MEKTVFKSKIFYWLLIVCLISFLGWNIYALTTGRLFAVIPITIQIMLLFFIFSQNKHTKLGIKIWAIFLLVGPSLSIIGKLMKIMIGDDINLMIDDLIKNLIFFIIGILIYSFNENTVVLEKPNEQGNENK